MALTARGTEAKVVDAGVSGDTATAALARLDWALPADADAVIIELGGNDALQGIPPEGTKAALEKIIERVQARGLPILLAGQEAPRNMGKDYVDQFRAIYAELASRYDVIFYPFFLEGAALNDDLMQADGIHPNAKGVAVIVERHHAQGRRAAGQGCGQAVAMAGSRAGKALQQRVGTRGGRDRPWPPSTISSRNFRRCSARWPRRWRSRASAPMR